MDCDNDEASIVVFSLMVFSCFAGACSDQREIPYLMMLSNWNGGRVEEFSRPAGELDSEKGGWKRKPTRTVCQVESEKQKRGEEAEIRRPCSERF